MVATGANYFIQKSRLVTNAQKKHTLCPHQLAELNKYACQPYYPHKGPIRSKCAAKYLKNLQRIAKKDAKHMQKCLEFSKYWEETRSERMRYRIAARDAAIEATRRAAIKAIYRIAVEDAAVEAVRMEAVELLAHGKPAAVKECIQEKAAEREATIVDNENSAIKKKDAEAKGTNWAVLSSIQQQDIEREATKNEAAQRMETETVDTNAVDSEDNQVMEDASQTLSAEHASPLYLQSAKRKIIIKARFDREKAAAADLQNASNTMVADDDDQANAEASEASTTETTEEVPLSPIVYTNGIIRIKLNLGISPGTEQGKGKGRAKCS